MRRLTLLAEIGAVLLATAIFAFLLGSGRDAYVDFLLVATVGVIGVLLVWFHPYLALVVIVASVPLEGLLVTIPYGVLFTQMVGVLALAAFLFHRNRQALFSYGVQPQLVLAAMFVIWQFMRDPEMSYYGRRNWLFTYAQLWILMWLASELLVLRAQRVLMNVYLVAAVASALFAFSQATIVGDFSAGSGLQRGEGLAENQNTLAFLLVLAFAMSTFLNSQTDNRWLSILYPLMYVALIMGVVGTVSRAGFVSLTMTLIATSVFWLGGQHRWRNLLLLGLALLIVVLFIIPDAYWEVLDNTLFTEDVNAEGNFGTRNALITAGWRMWQDYPVFGVGIDQFRLYNGPYLPLEYRWLAGKVQHNFYMVLLAETGIIGFMLFMGWIGVSMYQLFLTWRMKVDVYSQHGLIWLILFGLFLFRGITASTMHYNKLLFMMGGMSMLIYQNARQQRRAALQVARPVDDGSLAANRRADNYRYGIR